MTDVEDQMAKQPHPFVNGEKLSQMRDNLVAIVGKVDRIDGSAFYLRTTDGKCPGLFNRHSSFLPNFFHWSVMTLTVEDQQSLAKFCSLVFFAHRQRGEGLWLRAQSRWPVTAGSARLLRWGARTRQKRHRGQVWRLESVWGRLWHGHIRADAWLLPWHVQPPHLWSPLRQVASCSSLSFRCPVDLYHTTTYFHILRETRSRYRL